MGLSVYSGYKEVIENRESGQGRRIKIFVTVIPARKSDSVRSPLFHFEGGPGQPANTAIGYYASSPELFEYRDIVLIDARGTGRSNGLYCPAMQYNEPSQAFEDMYPPERLRACLEELKVVADLEQYSTANAIEDAEEIRRWLGYETINLIGFSYGTRAIEAYLGMYPTSVRSAILGGAAPASMHRPESFAEDSQKAWELICRDCADDPECNSKYPRLKEELNTLIKSLDEVPVTFKHYNTASGKSEDFTIRRGVVAEAIRTMMYSTDGQRKLPYVVHEAAQGNFGPIVERIIRRSMGYTNLSTPFYLCITCSEDVPFVDTENISSRINNTFLGDYRIRQETVACQGWPKHPYDTTLLSGVVSDVPVLIVSGTHDPVTPPRWAAVISRGMSNASLVTVNYMAHSGYGLSNRDCETASFAEYFDNPQKGFLMPCAAGMKPGPFKTD